MVLICEMARGVRKDRLHRFTSRGEAEILRLKRLSGVVRRALASRSPSGEDIGANGGRGKGLRRRRGR
jgi:hypothetical protein